MQLHHQVPVSVIRNLEVVRYSGAAIVINKYRSICYWVRFVIERVDCTYKIMAHQLAIHLYTCVSRLPCHLLMSTYPLVLYPLSFLDSLHSWPIADWY